MDYLKPIESLQASLKRDKWIIASLLVVLGVVCVALPLICKASNPLIITDERGFYLTTAKPWRLSVARLEGFTKTYLSSRFEWSEGDFDQKKKSLESIVDPKLFAQLKDSVSTFESLARSQHAKCYYVLEDYAFSNAEQKVQANITRVLRINNAALATPLTVQLSYRDSAISQANPYGLTVVAVSELPADSTTK